MTAAQILFLVELARRGFRGTIAEHVLRSLLWTVAEHGIETTLAWIDADPGLLLIPTAHSPWWMLRSFPMLVNEVTR